MRVMRIVIAAMILIMFVGAAYAQEISERQEVAVFKLSYYGQPEPPEPPADVRVEVKGPNRSVTVELRGSGEQQTDQLFIRAFGAVDEQIRSVFINLGRFDIIGMTQRLAPGTVDDFISVLRDYKEANAELPEAVLLGQQPFTEADFNELVGGFIVVVPSVSWYQMEQLESGDYRAEIETSFTFIDVQSLTTVGQFFVETTGIEESQDSAIKEAVDGIASQLTFEVRSLEPFKLKTGILDVDGRTVMLEFGRNMGLQLGDEYAIVTSRVLGTGHVAKDETGMIVIKEVQDEFSMGQVLYANPRPAPGDQLEEVPRLGVDLTGYGSVISSGTSSEFVAGIKGTVSRGWYAFRPLGGIELPVGQITNGIIPVNAYLGGEYNIYLGRLKIAPSAAIGGAVGYDTDSIGDDPAVALTHFGAFAKATANVLVSQGVMVFAEAGFSWWNVVDGIASWGMTSYGGLTIGAGVTIK